MTRNNPWMFLASLMLTIQTAATQPQWRTLPGSPSTPRHEDVWFINPLIGWIVNGSGQIYKTTSGGIGWQLQFEAPEYLRCVGFADSMRGWVGTLSGANPMYQTTNGGVTWTLVQNIPEPRPDGICGIWVVNDSVTYASGEYDGPARVIKTTDRGATWTSVDLAAYAGALVDCYFLNEDSGFVVGSVSYPLAGPARILFTSDGGQSWSVQHSGSNGLCWKISFPSANVGYVSVEFSNNLLKTTDRGATWTELMFAWGNQQGIGFVNDTLGWIGGSGNPTYGSSNGGLSWQQTPFGVEINRFRFLGDTLGYAVGQRVYKYSRDTTSVPVGESPMETVFSFKLHQNYPNPFNPTTNIEFQIPKSEFVSLKVFDVLGRMVRTLVNGKKEPGRHRVQFNAEGLPSGVYFYNLTAGSSMQTQKLMMLR